MLSLSTGTWCACFELPAQQYQYTLVSQDTYDIQQNINDLITNDCNIFNVCHNMHYILTQCLKECLKNFIDNM